MSQPYRKAPERKSTVEEIRERFDRDVERFSNLETGQSATVDAPLVLELITSAAAQTNPDARRALDIGCGAGNYSLKLIEKLPELHLDLVDLSRSMLDRAVERIAAVSSNPVRAIQADIRDIELETERYDVVVAAASLHHLRTDDQWEAVFAGVYRALRPGGSFWISDLVEHSIPTVETVMRKRYGEYLTALRNEQYRDQVFDYIDREDTPRTLIYQIDLLRRTGFRAIDVLHKNAVFAAFGAVK